MEENEKDQPLTFPKDSLPPQEPTSQLVEEPQTELPKKRSKWPKIVINILVLIVLLALGVFGYWFLKDKISEIEVASPTPSPTALPSPSPKPTPKTINSLIDYLDEKPFYATSSLKFSPDGKYGMWWVSDDGWSILIPEVESIGIVSAGAAEELKSEDSFTHQLINATGDYFSSTGFIKSDQNSSRSFIDETFYDYIQAYQKGEERCVVVVNPDEMWQKNGETGEMKPVANISVMCSENTFSENYEAQLPFLQALDERSAVIEVQTASDVAAKVSVNWRRTGAFALLVKVDGEWTKIYQGQDQPSCEVLEENNFPEEIHSECSP
jgi:hypothetical protein